MANYKTPPNFKDLSGQRFGRLVVKSRAADSVSPKGVKTVSWACICDCGGAIDTAAVRLVHGKTQSCGCLARESVRTQNRTHGHTVGGNSRTYRAWRDVIARCCYPSVKCYPRYGGAGITICDAWRHSFEAFLADVGECPDDALTIDRIDNARGYEPGNCRWVDHKAQARNRSICVLTEESAKQLRARRADGLTYSALALEFGVSRSTAAMCCTGQTWA